MTDWFLYMLRCGDGSLYTGVTTDVVRRLEEHSGTGKGAKYTRNRGPLQLVFTAKVGATRSTAQRVEFRVQRLSKAGKERMVKLGALPARLERILQ